MLVSNAIRRRLVSHHLPRPNTHTLETHPFQASLISDLLVFNAIKGPSTPPSP